MEIEYLTPKYIDVVKLQRKQTNKIEFLKQWLLITTTLDKETIGNLLLSEAYTHAIAYLVQNMNNPLVTDTYRANDFLNFQKENGKARKHLINGYVFNAELLTVKQADMAEKRCYRKRDEEILGFYFLAAMCQKGFLEGIDAIINSDYSVKTDNEIKAVLMELQTKGYCTIDLWSDFKNISLVTENVSIAIDDSFFLPK